MNINEYNFSKSSMSGKNYHNIVELTFFSIGFVSMGGITFYYIKNKLGKIIKTKIVNGIWNLLKLETITRMSFNKLINSIHNVFINPTKMMFIKKEPVDNKDVAYYMNGRLVKKLSYLEALNYQPQEEYNLIIYKMRNVKGDNTDYFKIFENHEDINDCFEHSQLKFISVEISIDELDKKVSLNLNDVNLYVDGNKLFTRPFITWFLMEKYGINLKDETKYTIYTIDNQINMDKFENSDNIVEYAVVSVSGYDKEIINKTLDKVSDKIVINEEITENVSEFDIKAEVVTTSEDKGGLLTNIIYSWFGYN
jgi:hypothetical protein